MKLYEERAYLAMIFARVCLNGLFVVNVLLFWSIGGTDAHVALRSISNGNKIVNKDFGFC
jgi:hypothetical protein